MRLVLLLSVLVFCLDSYAQARRVAPGVSALSASFRIDVAVKQTVDEANAYNRTKFPEFEKKKIAYSESLRLQTEREQKQLAAKYASAAAAREDLSADDLYYL